VGIDLNIDLRNEFTWLTKQLFVFVTADFETAANRLNQVVIWSHIIEKKVTFKPFVDHIHLPMSRTTQFCLR
jgi:hypothetical protein